MKDIKNQTSKYMAEVLRETVSLSEWPEGTQLPHYLRNFYDYYIMNLLNNMVLAVVDRTDEIQSIATIAKHIDRMRSYWNGEIVYVNTAVTSFNRNRLIEKGIPFIVPGNQMYVPTLGIDLREHFLRLKEKKETVSPATQVLLLYALLNQDYGEFTPGVMSTHLGYSPMTMTRAFDQLEALGIGEHRTEGKNRYLKFQPDGRSLWENCLPHLISPVNRQLYVIPKSDFERGMIAGESALSHLAMLSGPDNPVMAFGTKEWKGIEELNDIQEVKAAEPDALKVEIWKYPPRKLSNSGIVDVLSLYLSLKDMQDERVQSAIQQILGNMPW